MASLMRLKEPLENTSIYEINGRQLVYGLLEKFNYLICRHFR